MCGDPAARHPTDVADQGPPPFDRRPREPLQVLASNPRYFAEDGHAVYLTGSHTWNTFQDWDGTRPPRKFDFDAYLDFLQRHNHNFIRMYTWEQAAWFPGSAIQISVEPLPYVRTGPGLALDGQPRFDLTRFDPGYFARLHERVAHAGERGIYVSVMLFNGWSVGRKGHHAGNPWRGHPFHRDNNVNGIDGDADGDGEGGEVHTLANPSVTALQRRYVEKVVETLAEQTNVLWEISNESNPDSVDWQYEMIRTVKRAEAASGHHHPVGMTAVFPPTLDNHALFASGADWVSPHDNTGEPYGDDPPASNGDKVVLVDTDHIWGIGGSSRWVFESFLRGLNPIFMDPCVTATQDLLPEWPPAQSHAALEAPCPASGWDGVRDSLGVAHRLADRFDLAALQPRPELASTHYCLADPGREYLVLVPWNGGWKRSLLEHLIPGSASVAADVDLSAAQGPLDVEWIDLEHGTRQAAASVSGGSHVAFRAPLTRDLILHLKARASTAASLDR